MRIVNIVILALLSIVIAAPVNNFEDDLRQAAIQTKIAINKERQRLLINLSEAIVASNIAPKEEIERFQAYSDKFKSWNVTISNDLHELQHDLLPNAPSGKVEETLDKYTNGASSKLGSDFSEREKQQYAAFKIRASEIIDVAKKAGGANVIIPKELTELEQEDGNFQFVLLDHLLDCLHHKEL